MVGINNKKLLKTILQIVIILIIIIPKQELATSKVKLGDINNDSKIDQIDMLLVLRHISATANNKHDDWILTEDKFKAADITENGTIDSNDMLFLLRYIAANNSPDEIGKKHPEWLKLEKEIEVTGILLNKTDIELEKGKTETLKATIEPGDATNKEITWTSSNNTVVEVDKDGKITGKANGTAQITAETKSNGKKALCKVKVITSPTSIKINKSSISLDLSGTKTETLKATIEPTNTTNKNVTWTSSNNKIATIDKNGKLTAKNTGTVTITAKTKANGKKATCKVTIIRSIKSIKLSKTSLTINKGNTTTLKATITPTNATNKTITWKSNNTKVATVNKNGKLTAKSIGTVTITVKTKNGKTAKCKVTVKQTSLDFSYKGKKGKDGKPIVKSQFSSETMKIVENHLYDLNADNFHKVINSYGGFDKYAKNLGGIFGKYYGKKITGRTEYDFQMACEYVLGWMYMYGWDYKNGFGYDEGEHVGWGGRGHSYSPDAFYYNTKNKWKRKFVPDPGHTYRWNRNRNKF